ncbi:hypothetical protein AB1Y20_016350 [Prymnesium parvum]|uniref:Uncharacterized protein n=1 Tax=Prymnesium parvum TaxID=97485 RepID=A0AB34IDX2_PRYPA
MAQENHYMSVKDAIRELEQATLYARSQRRLTVRLPPMTSPPQSPSRLCVTSSVPGSCKGLSKIGGGSPPAQLSLNSSASDLSPRSGRTARGFGGKSPLNSPSTHYYGEEPLIPSLANNQGYSKIGNYSMFGSQALSERSSAGAFGFGSLTRDRWGNTYISPAHAKELYGRNSPPPNAYTLHSSLGRQVTHLSSPSRSFGLEERFNADRRDRRAMQTPGPGSYRV